MANLKNTGATLTVQQYIDKIKKILVNYNATKILEDYKDQQVFQVSFMLNVKDREIPYELPARVENVLLALYGKESTWHRYTPAQKEKASRVAWANVKDWIDCQMAFIDIGLAKPEEVFMPYMLVGEHETLYQRLEPAQFMLPNGGNY